MPAFYDSRPLALSLFYFRGLTPAEADLYFLENAKKCAQYGVDLFNVKDSKNMEVNKAKFHIVTIWVI